MAEYSEVTATATQWLRWRQFDVVNPRDDIPTFMFQEDKTTMVDGVKVDAPTGQLYTAYNPTYTFAIVDANGDPTATTMTLQALFNALESLYRHLAIIRDTP